MPFYDLRCQACGEEFNIMASVEDRMAGRISCPDCGAQELTPVFKTAHFSIKNEQAPACPHSHICGAGCHHAH